MPSAASKVHERILAGSRNIRFDDLCRLAEGFGFYRDRIGGSHRIYRHRLGLTLSLQPDRKHQAKLYQMRQLLILVEENGLKLDD
ncbi:MAG: type II toxin-antitoxin system HicA family toxin [Verrucomicrobia bacterium]|nr:type II toxin-antitoxin system HicA family toxin [Verrucomicrobiota bacterium]